VEQLSKALAQQSPDALNHEFGIADRVRFAAGAGGLTRCDVSTAASEAQFFLHGAHVAHFQRRGQRPVLFLSSRSIFENGKPIRGGVPLIFPWFGPRASDGAMHGLVRTRRWLVESVRALSTDRTEIVLALRSDDETRAIWPHDFVARLRLAIGAELEMGLQIENVSSAAFSFECAMHTYYAVSDVREVALHGLSGCEYLDKNLDLARVRDNDAVIRPVGPMDRVYVRARQACQVDDPAFNRRIVIEKEGSGTTVVWNPWPQGAAKLADLKADEWTRFVCVETANAKDDAIALAPGNSHEMIARIRTEPLA
jgi:glucose-6-phosphate 1-epimerase